MITRRAARKCLHDVLPREKTPAGVRCAFELEGAEELNDASPRSAAGSGVALDGLAHLAQNPVEQDFVVFFYHDANQWLGPGRADEQPTATAEVPLRGRDTALHRR